jgi:hypothetical protein
MSNKYILLRPDCGLNDVFCQVEMHARYAEQTDRILLVDTAYKNSHFFNSQLSRYFLSGSRRLLLDAGPYLEQLNQLNVFPDFLKNRINDYERVWNSELNGYCELNTNLPLAFDLSKHYDESLLVAHVAGGGESSFFSCARMRLRKELKEELVRRVQRLGGPYAAIHVRHTDHQTDYHDKLQELKKANIDKLFVATDNEYVIEEFKRELGSDRVYSFARLTGGNGRALHFKPASAELAYMRNSDSILDLLLLALAKELHILPLKKGGDKHSGFSLLARNLWASKIMLNRFIS